MEIKTLQSINNLPRFHFKLSNIKAITYFASSKFRESVCLLKVNKLYRFCLELV